MSITTFDKLRLAFIKALNDRRFEHVSVPAASAALDDFLASEAFRERMTEALVMVEEDLINPLCMSDSCDHPEGECPELSISCTSARDIIEYLRHKPG